MICTVFFFFKQKPAYEVRISDWSSDVCSSDLVAEVGDIELSRDGQVLRLLHPEKRSYISSEMPMTEAAIDANGLRHVYVALGEPLANGAWSVRVYYKPFVDWIWIGCNLMEIGRASCREGVCQYV